MINVGVLYATNFGSVSPGGIQSVVRALGATAPSDFRLTYVGAGDLDGDLPRPMDVYRDLLAGQSLPKGPLNLSYVRSVLREREWLSRFDCLVAHRCEYVPACLGLRSRKVLVLHGGTFNALRSNGVSPFGIAYAPVELIGRMIAQATYSVSPEDQFPRVNWLRPVRPLVVPLSADFDNVRRNWRSGVGRIPRITFCGRLEPEKRPELALRLAIELGVPLDVIGEGSERSFLERLARESGCEIRFFGQLSRTDIASYYRITPTVLVCVSRFEGYSVAVVEGAACGVPVVGLDGPGIGRAVSAIGGALVRRRKDLATACAQAWKVGNAIDAANVTAFHSRDAVGAAFWQGVRDTLQDQPHH